MSESINKNERCPCNSGKKYKDCHKKNPFVPKEKFTLKVDPSKQPKVTPTIATINGQQVDISNLFEIVVKGFTHKEKDLKIEQLIKSFIEKIPEKRAILKLRFERLEHKLNGIKYHLENFRSQENTIYQEYLSKEFVAKGSGMFLNEKDPKLMYETEAFLFQIKSCLDIFAQIIGMTYHLPEINTYGDSGETLINLLKNNVPIDQKNSALKFAEFLEEHKNWIKEVIDMRNDVTHFSDLTGFACFIEGSWKGKETINIYYPSMLDGTRAITYMENTYGKLLKLIENSQLYLNDFLN